MIGTNMSARAIVWTFVGVMALVAAYSVATDETPKRGATSSNEVVIDAEPAHYFAYDDGYGNYGYQVPLSDVDRAQGLGVKPYAMYSFFTMETDGRTYKFGTSQMRGQLIFRCTAPCTTVAMQSVTDPGTQVIPVAPGTVLSEVVHDMLAGQLKPQRRGMY